jgi:hypothetical protein
MNINFEQNRITLQWPTGRWFSPGPPVSSTNKTDRHNITEILLKVVLNTIKQTMVNVKIFKIERHHTIITPKVLQKCHEISSKQTGIIIRHLQKCQFL